MGELADAVRRMNVGSQYESTKRGELAARVERLEQQVEYMRTKTFDRVPTDAQRDRDALLAAVSELLGRGADIVFLDRVTEMTDPMIGNVTALVADSCRLETEAPIARDARPGWYVAILAPSTAPNPELLERASTMLAEAYIAATKDTK